MIFKTGIIIENQTYGFHKAKHFCISFAVFLPEKINNKLLIYALILIGIKKQLHTS